MSNKIYLVTGATGSTGKEISRLLIGKGHKVRVLVHKEDDRSAALAGLGAEIAVGDLLDLNAVSAALQGIEGAYFCYPIAPGLIQATAYFAQAALEAGVKTIVNMSQISSRRDSQSHAAQDHWIAERIFDRSGVNTTHVRPTFFAEWLLYAAPVVGTGFMRTPLSPEARHAPVAAEDQARVIANILDRPEGHEGKIYPLFGAREVTQTELAAIVGKTLGISLAYEQVDAADWVGDITSAGVHARHRRENVDPNAQAGTEFLIQHLRAVAQDHKEGLFSGNNDVVEKIGQTKPLTVEEFVEKHRSLFKVAASAR